MQFLSVEDEKRLISRVLGSFNGTKDKEFGVLLEKPYINAFNRDPDYHRSYVVRPKSEIKSVNKDDLEKREGYIGRNVCVFFDKVPPIEVSLEDFDRGRAAKVRRELREKYGYTLESEIIHKLNYNIDECIKFCRVSYYNFNEEADAAGHLAGYRNNSDRLMDNV